MESTQQCKGGRECVVEPDTQDRPVTTINKRQQQYQQYRQRKQPAAIPPSESNKLMTEENILCGIFANTD